MNAVIGTQVRAPSSNFLYRMPDGGTMFRQTDVARWRRLDDTTVRISWLDRLDDPPAKVLSGGGCQYTRSSSRVADPAETRAGSFVIPRNAAVRWCRRQDCFQCGGAHGGAVQILPNAGLLICAGTGRIGSEARVAAADFCLPFASASQGQPSPSELESARRHATHAGEPKHAKAPEQDRARVPRGALILPVPGRASARQTDAARGPSSDLATLSQCGKWFSRKECELHFALV